MSFAPQAGTISSCNASVVSLSNNLQNLPTYCFIRRQRLSGRAPSYPGAPHGIRRADFPHRALRTSSSEQGRVARNHRDMGLGLCVPAMCGLTIRRSSAPSLHGHYPPFPGTMGRSDTRHPHVGLGITLPATPPAKVTGPMAGSRGFRALPVPACPAGRGMGARLLSPWRATAAAFPAVAYGSASTVSGISGLVPFTPAACGFRPTGFLPACALHADRSTLRPGRSPAQTQYSVPATGWLARSPVGLPAHPSVARSPTGKRRLRPAHAAE